MVEMKATLALRRCIDSLNLTPSGLSDLELHSSGYLISLTSQNGAG